MIIDEQERIQALNPTQSFIVQAPAGSGKTELLSQRFLVLLNHVKQPEEILAITFTKKSAAEMRTRILKALKNAAHNPEPESPHAKKTWELARAVLQKDYELKWNIIANPNRLRLQTIDSFNASITKQLPILSHFGATPEIVEDATPLYREAVQEFLTHLEENLDWSDAIATLLLHMDNNLNQVEELLIHMLAKRDQWLPYITLNSNDPLLKQTLENHLADLISDTLTRLVNSLPKQHCEELLTLLRYAATHLALESSSSAIVNGRDLLELPGTTANHLLYWRSISELLFKSSDHTWRKRWDKSLGFPAVEQFKNPAEKSLAKTMKERMSKLVDALSQQDDFVDALTELNTLPDQHYNDLQWETLAALHDVLRIVVAQLKVTFQLHGKIDFIENSQAALLALGHDDQPTDLTLALDYQIKHILIDEFQDTANSQYRLLEKITAGWQANDSRTLFVVGDPMQSIYRFREAEVGLFIRAKSIGIGSVPLIPLTLSVNFRSTNQIVSWVNQHFTHVFPSYDDIANGAVSYSPSSANQTDEAQSFVKLHPFLEEEDQQAQQIVAIVQQTKQQQPKNKIAILVRSRTHLKEIIPALKQANISYRAIDIDPLTERPFIQDLISLTKALLNPADRIAWLAILRAPWCGLTLSDLLLLSGQDPNITLWERLQRQTVIATCSADAQSRLQRIMPILTQKMHERKRYSLQQWVESAWILLGGPACLAHETELEDAKAYFKLLAKLDVGGDLANIDLLANYVDKLYASPDTSADDSLQIMTIHNSKGLEFDTVILPQLQRKSANDDKQLLLWMERPRAENGNALILAPVHAIGEDRDSIYEYIKFQQAIKNDFEKSRLLYVAVTRAKKQLHLLFNVKSCDKQLKPATNSLLEKLWPAIVNQIPSLTKTATITTSTVNREPIMIKRLPPDWQNPVHESRLSDTKVYHNNKFGFLLPNQEPQIFGTVIHRVLQKIATSGISWWQSQSMENRAQFFRIQFLQLGLPQESISFAIDQAQLAITNTLADTRGKWILHSHKEATAELPLTSIIDGNLQQLIIDRTFVDENNVRWIIDYKTSHNHDADLHSFLDSEQAVYQDKMSIYQHALQALDERKIKLGLYFPLISAWREWEV